MFDHAVYGNPNSMVDPMLFSAELAKRFRLSGLRHGPFTSVASWLTSISVQQNSDTQWKAVALSSSSD